MAAQHSFREIAAIIVAGRRWRKKDSNTIAKSNTIIFACNGPLITAKLQARRKQIYGP